MAEPITKTNAVNAGKRLDSSDELKARVLNAVYESDRIAPLSGYKLLAGRHLTTNVGIVVIDGDFNRDAFKLAVDEIKAAGLKASRMYAYGRTGSYSGQAISFSKFSEIGVELPDAVPALREVTRTVCRVGYGFADVTVSVPNDAAEPDIETAVLDAAGNHSYSEKEAHYEMEGGSGPELKDEVPAVVLAQLLDTLSGLGFSADQEISGADAVDAIAQAYAVAVERLKGSSGEPCVIFSQSEDGFWNKDLGWGDAASATHYFITPSQLPLSQDADAKLVPLSTAEGPQASVALEEDIYSGFVRVEGKRIQLDFSAPTGASQLEVDAAFFGALTMATDVDYLKIGTRPRT